MDLKTIVDTLSGNFVSKDEKQKRLQQCSKCEHKEVILGVDNCGKCKCILNWKAAMIDEKCPVGKW